MNGSEKQIKWAVEKVQSEILANNRRLADEQACFAADKAAGLPGNAERLDVRNAIHAIIDRGLQSLLTDGNASDIINHGIDRTRMLAGHMAEVPHHDWIRKAFPIAKDFQTWIK